MIRCDGGDLRALSDGVIPLIDELPVSARVRPMRRLTAAFLMALTLAGCGAPRAAGPTGIVDSRPGYTPDPAATMLVDTRPYCAGMGPKPSEYASHCYGGPLPVASPTVHG